ncbi:MAG: ABC-F family ATP-binding cassette domain-containing protein [Candidatus Promineifilaceae bacterium]
MATVLLNLDKIGVNLGGRQILQGADLELQMGQRVGLVGANGAGKSTLMKVISAELDPDEGNVFRVSGLKFGRLEQEPIMDGTQTVLQETLTASPELTAVEKQLDELETAMSDPAVYENAARLNRVMNQHSELLGQFERLGGAQFESQAKRALMQLGLDEKVWNRPVNVLSGGQKKLILLAKLIVQKPQLLLLDEPDNHLDVPSKRRLEKLLNAYQGCVLIISHDRYLLDEVATHIAELDAGKVTLYHGNYTAFTTERELRRLRQQQMYVAQQKEIARIEAAIARFEKWASMVIDERHIKQARSRRKMLDKMDKIESVEAARKMTLELSGWRGSNKVIELVNVSKMLPDATILWDELNLILWHGARVGLVGPNGAGKSMLLKQLLDPEGVDEGEIKIGPSSRIGYYAQEQETLNMDSTLVDEIRAVASMTEGNAVAFLNRFLFDYDQVRDKVRNLSGGERSRLQLAQLVLQQPNLLLLDEPTNNLDITSIEVLEQTMDEFVGTVLVISHDRYFLDQVVDQIIELRDGQLTTFVGGYTDYLAEIEKRKGK